MPTAVRHPNAERLAVGAWALAVFLAGLIPYLVAYAAQDSAHVFLGTLHFSEDADSYAAFIRQAADGDWLFDNPYLPPGEHVYFNGLWLALGKLAALGLGFGAIWQLLRAAAAAALAFGFDRLARALGLRGVWRHLGLAWFLFGGGFAFLTAFVALPVTPVDASNEFYPFLQILAVPHAGLAHGLLLFALALALESGAGSPRRAWAAGLVLALIATFRPYEALVGAAVLGVWGAWRFAAERNRAPALRLAAWLVPVLPLFAYDAWLTQAAPGFAHWSRTNVYPPAAFPAILLGLGLLAPLSLAGLWHLWRRHATLSFLVVWLVVAWGLLESGLLPFAWRTTSALATPHLLAALGLAWPFRTRARVALGVVLILLCLPTSVWLVQYKTRTQAAQNRYNFVPPELFDAFAAIDDHACRLVWTHGFVALKIPAATHAHAMPGHKDLIPDFVSLLAVYGAYAEARTPAASAAWRHAGADCVLWGPLDARAGGQPPRQGLREVYANGLYTLYQRKAP